MRVAVGLGNPGARFACTRHNLGFKVVDVLASNLAASWTETPTFQYTEVVVDSETLVLVKPSTYMNRSGVAFAELQKRFEVEMVDVLVLVDDVHLDFARIRFRSGGSHGGHKGLKSIFETAGSFKFPRMRIGVGSPPHGGELIEYVLAVFDSQETKDLDKLVQKASDGVQCWAIEGIDVAMNRFNSI